MNTGTMPDIKVFVSVFFVMDEKIYMHSTFVYYFYKDRLLASIWSYGVPLIDFFIEKFLDVAIALINSENLKSDEKIPMSIS